MFQLEKGVPLPDAYSVRKRQYPFAQMEIGDSFSAPEEMRARLSAALSTHKRRHGGEYRILRDSRTTVRCYRIA